MISLSIFTENMKFFAWTFLNSSKLEDEKVLKNVRMQRGGKAKNVKGVFFTDKTGTKKIVLMNAMIFAF